MNLNELKVLEDALKVIEQYEIEIKVLKELLNDFGITVKRKAQESNDLPE